MLRRCTARHHSSLRLFSTAKICFAENEASNKIQLIHQVPPTSARVVICGGGVMGASVAYHLAKLGWGSETVLIEQNR